MGFGALADPGIGGSELTARDMASDPMQNVKIRQERHRHSKATDSGSPSNSR
jgi:hypothetical protein